MRRLSTAVFVLVFVAGMTACHSKPDDKDIAKDIQAKIAADPATQDSKVSVASQNGEVTLTGSTKTADAKQQAARIAKEEPGVSAVNDQTSVGEELASGSAPAGAAGTGAAEHAAPAPAPAAAPQAPPPPPPPPPPLVVPAGTVLTVRINEALSSKTVQTGAAFTGVVMTPITLGGKMAIPQGSDVTGIVSDAKKAGKFKGGASLTLALDSVTVNGHKYNIVTEYFAQESKGKGKRTAGMIGGGAGVGAAIGGLAGGGKGAAIGALTGAAAGTAGAAFTGNNRDIELPAESALSFKLDQSLTINQGD